MASDFDPRETPWALDDSAFPSEGGFEDQARVLLSYAVLAPSGHNTQPWKFRIGDDSVLIYADRRHRLPVADPEDRELTVSVGAAITNLKVAAARFGMRCSVEYTGEGKREESLARATLSRGEPEAGLADLFGAVTSRRTNRFACPPSPLADRERAALDGVGAFGSAGLTIVDGAGDKDALASLAARGDEIRMADKAFRVELSEWIWTAGSRRYDGIATDAVGIPGPLSSLGPWIIRTFNSGRRSGKQDAALLKDSAAAVVFYSPDTVEGWLETGELLERFLLTITGLGMQYSFFSLPVEVAETRAEMKKLLDLRDEPQILIRAGYGPPPPTAAMPRRPLDEVIVR